MNKLLNMCLREKINIYIEMNFSVKIQVLVKFPNVFRSLVQQTLTGDSETSKTDHK